ncbi:hypothetical protein ACQ4PT_042594 [Festuca glaucescens]
MDKYCELTPEEAVAERKRTRADTVQSKLTTEKREQKRARACEYICQWFYEACIPFNAVTLPSFDLMLQSIGQYGEDLEGPTPYQMGGPILKKWKKRVAESFKAHRKTWELRGCTIMTDAWTDLRGRGVMNLVIHSAYGVVFVNSVDCSAVKKDGKYIFELVDSCIEEVGEKHVVQVVKDNASVNQAASNLLKAKRPNIFWNGCAAHSIDLMLEDIGKLKSVDETITKARGVTVFLYAHTRVLSLMREFLGKDLVRSGITRFATAYLNLRSMLDSKKELQKLFRSDQMDEMGYLKKVKGSEAKRSVRSDFFWEGVDIAVKFFEPLANLLRRMDSDVPAMGFIFGAFLDAKREILARFEDEETNVQKVLDIVDKRWDRKLKGPLHRDGYFLNSYYYYENKLEIELDGTFKDGLVACMEKMVRDGPKEDIMMAECQAYQDEERPHKLLHLRSHLHLLHKLHQLHLRQELNQMHLLRDLTLPQRVLEQQKPEHLQVHKLDLLEMHKLEQEEGGGEENLVQLQLLGHQASGVHGLAEDLESDGNGLLADDAVTVVLLEHGLGGLVVGPDGGGLPPAVVAGGVAHVELEAVNPVPAGEEEGDAEGAEASKLSVALLGVAEGLEELLDGDGLLVGERVGLGVEAGGVDEDHAVRRDDAVRGSSRRYQSPPSHTKHGTDGPPAAARSPLL